MSDPPEAEWKEYRREVLGSLRDLREDSRKHSDHLVELKVELAVLKNKVMLFAAAASLGVTAIVEFGLKVFGR